MVVRDRIALGLLAVGGAVAVGLWTLVAAWAALLVVVVTIGAAAAVYRVEGAAPEADEASAGRDGAAAGGPGPDQ